VWDARSGESLRTLKGHRGPVSSSAWSGDGRRIISGSWDNTLQVWDARSGESLRTLEGHRGAVSSCAWSGDGGRIVSASNDGTVRVWDAATGALLLSIFRFPRGEEAAIGESPRRVLRASPGAWRWLGWLAPDPSTGAIDRYPYETFRE